MRREEYGLLLSRRDRRNILMEFKVPLENVDETARDAHERYNYKDAEPCGKRQVQKKSWTGRREAISQAINGIPLSQQEFEWRQEEVGIVL
jgi:hypothetical protein